jgi:glycosyltransferase involved in cell wall biosynthesis
MKNKIVIACLGHDLSGGGAERVALQLLNLLDRDLFSIELSYLRNYGELHRLIPLDLTPTFFVEGTTRFRNTISPAFREYRAIARRADILFGMTEGIPIYLASLIGLLESKPSVGWSHSTTSRMFMGLNSLHRILMPLLFPHVSQIVCVSEGARADLTGLYNFKKRSPITIYNPLEIKSVRSMGAQPLPEAVNAWYERPTVIGVGRLVQEKRIDRLIRAFAIAIGDGLDANLILLGQGPLQVRLQEFAKVLGISSRVFFAGFQSNPYPYMKSASVLVLSSASEGFGMALLEAMALGTPVISTDCPGGPRELLQDGRNGILTPSDDPDAMAAAIATMVRDDEARRNYVTHGLERVEDFKASRIVQQFESVFLQLVRQ